MRLIDADALIESIKEELWHWDTVDGINATTVLKQTISDINNMPTIEQPKIIHCRECKLINTGYCNMANGFMWMKDDDYCSYGERWEAEDGDTD